MFWKGRTAIEGLSGRTSCSTEHGCLCSYEDSRDRDDGRRQSDGFHFTLKPELAVRCSSGQDCLDRQKSP
jgi:hypothetical protein